ncbi:MAG: type II secretion system F family protein [Patescibacteria group bacterium]
MKYNYQARSKEGKIEIGTVEASSREAAAVLLQKYNIFVTSLKEQSSQNLFFTKLTFTKKISKKDLAIISRQLAVMLESRVPVTQSLAGLAAQTSKQSLKEKLIKISQLVDEGNPLSEAFAYYPEVFNKFYVSLIKTGEASGKISESLYYLSDHLEREYDIESQVRGAMIYPIFVISVLLVVITIVIFGVMPRISDLIKETTTDPPFFTALMIGFYDFLSRYGWIVILGFVMMIGFIIYYFRTPRGRKTADKLSLNLPAIGGFFKKIFLIRFTENLSTLISAGLSINSALKITKDTIDNYIYKEIISETEKGVSEGEKISSILIRHSEYVPPFVIQMIEVGEQTGRLDKNLMEVVNFYRKEVKRSVDTFITLLEPVLIIFLGGVVALLAISVLSPLYGALGTI